MRRRHQIQHPPRVVQTTRGEVQDAELQVLRERRALRGARALKRPNRHIRLLRAHRHLAELHQLGR